MRLRLCVRLGVCVPGTIGAGQPFATTDASLGAVDSAAQRQGLCSAPFRGEVHTLQCFIYSPTSGISAAAAGASRSG